MESIGLLILIGIVFVVITVNALNVDEPSEDEERDEQFFSF